MPAPMNDLERQLDYPLGETLPASGASVAVAPGVRWVRMRLPFQLDHVNLWLLRDAIDGVDGWTIVDCGIADDATRADWESIFANELDGLPVLRVIVTHMHPDHIGLAHWLTERWRRGNVDCRLWISATDHATAVLASSGLTSFGGDSFAEFLASHGLVDEASLANLRIRTQYYTSMVPAVPSRYRRLLDGDTVRIGGRDWRCHVGHGHAPEHMSFHCAATGLLISGDMVLPRISTNVSVHESEPESDPLRRYLDSIAQMRSLPADVLVLPSHGRPFKGLHTRIDQLVAHHDERFADVLRACAEAPQHGAALLPLLFRRALDLHQTTFAMGESIAHLNALWLDGRLTRRLDDDGIYRFSAA